MLQQHGPKSTGQVKLSCLGSDLYIIINYNTLVTVTTGPTTNQTNWTVMTPAVQMMCKEHQDQASSHLELLERELKQRHKNSQGGD
jgi:hypothetical protein